jgi:hypothetical protein
MSRRSEERKRQQVLAAHDETCEAYKRCPECGAETECNLEFFMDQPHTVVECPECGVLGEFELCPRNEASVRY